MRHIFVPQSFVAHTLASEELPSASPTLVYLNSVLVPFPLHFRASAKQAFFLFIEFDYSLTLANIAIPKDFSLIFVHYIANVYTAPSSKYEVRLDDKSIDIQMK